MNGFTLISKIRQNSNLSLSKFKERQPSEWTTYMSGYSINGTTIEGPNGKAIDIGSAASTDIPAEIRMAYDQAAPDEDRDLTEYANDQLGAGTDFYYDDSGSKVVEDVPDPDDVEIEAEPLSADRAKDPGDSTRTPGVDETPLTDGDQAESLPEGVRDVRDQFLNDTGTSVTFPDTQGSNDGPIDNGGDSAESDSQSELPDPPEYVSNKSTPGGNKTNSNGESQASAGDQSSEPDPPEPQNPPEPPADHGESSESTSGQAVSGTVPSSLSKHGDKLVLAGLAAAGLAAYKGAI